MFTSPAALYRADSPSLIHRAGLLRKQLVVRYGSTAPELAAVPNPKVFLDLSIGGGEPQRVTFELFAQIAPKTAENFRALCTGEKGVSTSGTTLHYKGSQFFRVVPEFMCQGGDITNGDGTGGESSLHFDSNLRDESGKIQTEFRDENFRIKHSEAGLLAMSNKGRHTNTSQFYITFDECKWLNGKHVVFGTVVDGLRTLRAIEDAGSPDGQPLCSIQIVDCGEL